MPRSLYDHNDGDKVRKPKTDRDPDVRGLLHLYLEWPNGYPGRIKPLPQRWEHDPKYRRECLESIHRGMNADALEAAHQQSMRELHERTALSLLPLHPPCPSRLGSVSRLGGPRPAVGGQGGRISL